jgi:plasmid stability protein
MPKTLKIDNVDDVLVERLSDRAMRHGRTVEAEHRAILTQALEKNSSFDELATKLRAMLEGRHHTPAEELLRESRSER